MNRTKHHNHQATGIFRLAAALLLAGAASLAHAQGSFWNVAAPATGSWSNASNWTSAAWPWGLTPVATVIDNGGTATIAAGDNVTDNTGNGNIYISDSRGSGTVNMTGGVLNIMNSTYANEYLGCPSSTGTTTIGTFNQSGGINIRYSEGGDFSTPSSPWVMPRAALEYTT